MGISRILAALTVLSCRSYSVQSNLPRSFSHMPQPHQPRIHFTPHCGEHFHVAGQVGRRLAFHVGVHGEDRIFGVSHAPKRNDHGILEFGALPPGLAFAGQLEAQSEGAFAVGVDGEVSSP